MKLESTRYPGVFYRLSEKNNDKSFYIVYRIGKKTVQECVGKQSKGCNPTIASQIRNAKLEKISIGETLPNRITLDKACDYYLESVKHKKSYKRIHFLLTAFKNHMGSNCELKNITSVTLISYINFLKAQTTIKGKPLMPQTIKHYVVVIRQMFNFCINTDFYMGKSPINKSVYSCLPKVNNTIINYLENDEIKTFFKVMEKYEDKNLAHLFLFAFFTGIRVSEIFNLEWKDVDIEKECVTLRSPKSGQDEYVILSDAAIAILKKQRELIPENIKYVFPNSHMQKRTTVANQFKTVKKKMGLNRYFRFHDLRHNFATMLMSGGAGLNDVKTALTHKDIKTTLKYAHIRNERLKKTANIVSNLVSSEFHLNDGMDEVS